MKPQQKDLSIAVMLAVLAGVVLGALGFYFFLRGNPMDVTFPIINNSASSTPLVTPVVATSTVIDTSNWQTYTSYELGFSIKYPADLTIDTSDPTTFKASFSRADYFSTVYGDDVVVNITVGSICQPIIDSAHGSIAENIMINGTNFVRNESNDVAAGNVYDDISYDAINNNACYRIIFSDHHANGAGLYEGDPAKAAVMDATRAKEFAHVSDIVSAMISSFTFVYTPTGENEASYSAAAQAGSSSSIPTSTISIDTVSPMTVSVGNQLTLSGQGFSGHDTIVWISNGSVKGVLWGGMPSNDSSITAPLPSKACTSYVGASGLPCPSYLIISPGIYTVDVVNQNGTTDNIYIKVQ